MTIGDMHNVHICSFSAGLDGMKKKDQKDVAKVLAVLKECKRFSCFEATENMTIAKTVTLAYDRKLIKSVGGSFPWTDIEITPEGEQVIAGGPIPPFHDPLLDGMVRVGKRTYVSESIAKEHGLTEYIEK